MMSQESKKFSFALSKENYILMAIGFAVVIIGLFLLSGGGTKDPNVFSQELFSFRRITLAPIVILVGFIFEIYAIMKKPKKENSEA
jgi:membrane-bound ClpP family serine protease